MHWKSATELASVLIATLTFVLATVERVGRERREEVENWQRLSVYQIVVRGTADFEKIRDAYATSAIRYPGRSIPRNKIQDDALLLALLSLMESKLIVRTPDELYLPVFSSPEEQARTAAVQDSFLRREKMTALGELIMEILRTRGGQLNMEDLFIELQSKGSSVTFSEVVSVVSTMIPQGILLVDSGRKLWLKAMLPTTRPNSGTK